MTRTVRAVAVLCAAGVLLAGCTLSGSEEPADDVTTIKLVTHDSFVAPQEIARRLPAAVRHPHRGAQGGRRRRADEQTGADQGQPDRRRGLRRRHHLRHPRAQRGRVRAVHQPGGRPRPAALRHRPRAPAVRGRRRRCVREHRHRLVRREGPARAEDLRRPRRSAVQGHAGGGESGDQSSPAWPSCSARSRKYGPQGWSGLLGQAQDQRRQGGQRLGRSPTARSSPDPPARDRAAGRLVRLVARRRIR